MRAWLEIDLGKVVENARKLAERVRPAALCAVIKANAYGHGLVPVGKALASAGIAHLRLAVFNADEGLALREAGVAVPILIVGPVGDEALASVKQLGLEAAVLEPEDVERYHPGTVVHLKVDSGVARFGVRPDEAAALATRARARGLLVAGVYSHLANAEDLDDAFTREQIARLRSVSGRDGIATHIAASAAAIMWPHARLDMARCGIAVYGRWPSNAVRDSAASAGLALEPALRWFAPVVQTHQIDAGESVGYGRAFVASRATTVAVLPLGYSDGLPRAAGDGKLEVTIDGARAPVVGRICMNACMLDVSGVPGGVRRGDVAELDVDDVARAAGTIDYEVLAALPASVQRRYL